MNHITKLNGLLCSVLLLLITNFAYANDSLKDNEQKKLVRDAVRYALENKDPNMDYSKYVSPKFINPIDGKVFNYEQWVTHQKNIKAMVKSMKPTFDVMVSEGNRVATIFHIDIVKNDGSKLSVKDMAFFTIENNKIVYVEELTRLIKGDPKDKNIGSTS